MLGGIALLLLCQLLGELIVQSLELPFPGPVLGMVFMLGMLIFYRDVPQTVRTAAEGLLRYLALLFIPIAVAGIVGHAAYIHTNLLPLTIAILGSSALGIMTTALVFRVLMGKIKEKP